MHVARLMMKVAGLVAILISLMCLFFKDDERDEGQHMKPSTNEIY